MMLKEKSSPWARLKYVYVLPLACLTMLAFARPDVTNVETNVLAQAETAMRSVDKNSENSGNNNSGEVKKAVPSRVEDLLAYNEAQATTASAQKTTDPVNSSINVTGKVLRSSDKQPLGSVNVVEVDPSNRILNYTITKEDGTFEMKVKNRSNKLKFSCVGFKQVVCSVMESLTIQLEENTLSMNEIVVVGYAAVESTEKKVENPTNTDGVFGVEQMPQYPGGDTALGEYLRNSIKYPASASAKGAEGRVVCSCVISAQGTVVDVKVMTSVDPDLDKEAMRVVLNMPNWIPGKQNGKSIPVKYAIPIQFKINK